MKTRLGRRPETEDDTDINMTPMLDVIFILLIFFVVTTSFVKEAGIEVSRPKAATASHQEQASIVVAIDRNGEIWVDKRRIEMGAVTSNVERLHIENPQSAVLVMADRASKNGVLVEVLDRIRRAGVEKIAIVAEEHDQ